jgi:hypothetical protein
MIDRKALWISILIFLAITAATLWRLSLLPDWHHVPMDGPAGQRSASAFYLFSAPAALLLEIALLFGRKWWVSGPEESIQSWSRWGGQAIVTISAIIAVVQAIAIARSLGLGAGLDRMAVGHGMQVLMGIFVMMLGNALPKMPFLSVRFRPFRLDPWQWNRHLRLIGKLMVGLGFFVAVGGPLLPHPLFRNIVLGLWLAMMAANILYRIKLRREPPGPILS